MLVSAVAMQKVTGPTAVFIVNLFDKCMSKHTVEGVLTKHVRSVSLERLSHQWVAKEFKGRVKPEKAKCGKR